MKRSSSAPPIANPFKALQPQAAATGAKIFLSDEQVLVQTPDIPRVFLVEPEHKAALRRALMGNGRSRHAAWLEQQRARQAALDAAAAEKSALDDAEGADDEKKGGAGARVSKESLALELLRRKEKNKAAEQDAESTLNSAAAAVDSTALYELDATRQELKQLKVTFGDLLVTQPEAAAAAEDSSGGARAAGAQPVSIMQREKMISQREKRLVTLQKSLRVMEDRIERCVAADDQRQTEFDGIKAEVGIVQRAIDTPGSIAKAADIASKRRRAQAMMAKALKLNKKNQGVAEKLPASEAVAKNRHEGLAAQAMALQEEYQQISRDIQEVERQHLELEQAMSVCERSSAVMLLQYGPRLPRAAALPDVALFPIAPLKQELELLYQRQFLTYRTQIAESKLEELNAIWGRLEELKEDERCGPACKAARVAHAAHAAVAHAAAAAHAARARAASAFALTRVRCRLLAMKRFKQTCLADSSK